MVSIILANANHSLADHMRQRVLLSRASPVVDVLLPPGYRSAPLQFGFLRFIPIVPCTLACGSDYSSASGGSIGKYLVHRLGPMWRVVGRIAGMTETRALFLGS